MKALLEKTLEGYSIIDYTIIKIKLRERVYKYIKYIIHQEFLISLKLGLYIYSFSYTQSIINNLLGTLYYVVAYHALIPKIIGEIIFFMTKQYKSFSSIYCVSSCHCISLTMFAPCLNMERTIVYKTPFAKCDREEDYEVAWAEFERRRTT